VLDYNYSIEKKLKATLKRTYKKDKWGAPLKVDSKLRNKIIGVQHEDKTAIHTGF
jgi:hypothetical protein